MSTELIIVLVAIIAGGVALGWMIVTGFHELRMEVRAICNSPNQQTEKSRREIRSRTKELRGKVLQSCSEIDGLRREMETRLSTVGRQQAKLEGLLEGLREAITGRKAA